MKKSHIKVAGIYEWVQFDADQKKTLDRADIDILLDSR